MRRARWAAMARSVLRRRDGRATTASPCSRPRTSGPARSLAQYALENAAYAGMNGTYLCPPDYADCANKVNSYEYAVYNSVLRKWLNPRAINSQNGLAVWNGATPTFYRRGATYAQSSASQTPPTAAISNYPLLLQ